MVRFEKFRMKRKSGRQLEVTRAVRFEKFTTMRKSGRQLEVTLAARSVHRCKRQRGKKSRDENRQSKRERGRL